MIRRREFAMLKSVGMTDRSLNKMMNLECLFYGLKAILFALPVSCCIAFLIYRVILEGVDITFTLPVKDMALAAAGVFAIVFVTMLYSMSKIKKQNTVDELRND
jgi:putative ABC transport system permease protein